MIAITWPALPLLAPHFNTRTMRDAPAEITDESLVRDTLAGDERAFAEIVSRHKGRVFGTCSRFARDSQELDELSQEVFLKAWRKLKSFRGDAPFEHWLSRITITSCYDFLRRERRHRETVSIDDMVIEMRDTGVDAAISAGRAKELLDWAMRQLSADERLILTLLEIEEHSVREIAASTGWSESNVKVRAFRARGKLKQKRHPTAMNTDPLDKLFAAARADVPDTARAEFGFETRLLARLREERAGSIFAWAWKLCPYFAALALAVGAWGYASGGLPDGESVLASLRQGGLPVLDYYFGGDE